MSFVTRAEEPEDVGSIRSITREAFDGDKHSDGTEYAIIDALRDANALQISLVATSDGEVIGYVAFSPVTVGGDDIDWYGLGPVSVKRAFQGRGVGQMMIREGLRQLWCSGAQGCVVLGSPVYYSRFGFERAEGLVYADAPAEYFMALSAGATIPTGTVAYHSAFGA